MFLGGYLSLWIGPTVAVPVAPDLLEGLEAVTVTHNDQGRSGFQLTFQVGRNRSTGLLDYPPLMLQQLRPGFRVILVATLNAMPHVIMDGIIARHQLAPGDAPSSSKLTITGEDVSIMMDLHELNMPYPAMPDFVIATTLIAKYAAYGMVPLVIPHPSDTPPLPTETVPQREGTDLAVLNRMAEQWGYVFYVSAGPLPGMNTAYWGPPLRSGLPQRALTVNMGPDSNATLQFQQDATQLTMTYGLVQDRTLGVPVPVLGVPARQPLSALPALVGNLPFVRTRRIDEDQGGDAVRAMASASSEDERAADNAVTASGEVDVGRYGTVLKARQLVDVRGVGLTYDGSWYVQSATHTITKGSYKQSFNLQREGTLPLSPVVRP